MFLSQKPSKINKNVLSVGLLRRFLRSKTSYPQHATTSNIPKEPTELPKERPYEVPKEGPKDPKEMPKEPTQELPKEP